LGIDFDGVLLNSSFPFAPFFVPAFEHFFLLLLGFSNYITQYYIMFVLRDVEYFCQLKTNNGECLAIAREREKELTS